MFIVPALVETDGNLQNIGVSRYEKILVPFISSFPYGAVGADGKN